MIPLQYPALEFAYVFVCELYKAIGRKGEPPKDSFSAPGGEVVTYLDVWHALRSMSQYFESTIKGVTAVYDYRQTPVAMSVEEIVEFFLMIAVEVVDHDIQPEQRRPFTSFNHCEYCYQELAFTIHGFLDCLTHADFGISYNVSNKLFCQASASAILEGVRLDKEDVAVIQDIVENAIVNLDSTHQIPELGAFIHEGVRELGGAIDPEGLSELLDAFEPTPEPERTPKEVVESLPSELPSAPATLPAPAPPPVPAASNTPAAAPESNVSVKPSADSFKVEQQQVLPDLPLPPVASPQPTVATVEAPSSEEITEPEDGSAPEPGLQKPRLPD